MSVKDWWGGLFGRPREATRDADASTPIDIPRVPTGEELLTQLTALETDIDEKARSERISGVVACGCTTSAAPPATSSLG
ncbi:MAG: hypothetical protein U0Q19_08615 [Kineosporiaceae bacterium]